MHYYTFNIGDYHSHTSHLDPLEDLAYRRMLDWVYLHESPLPENIKQIAKLIRLPDEIERITSVLREHFDLCEYGYTQKKAMQQIEKFKDKSNKAKAAIDERWARERMKRDTDVLQTNNERNTNQEPITKNQEPLKEKELSVDSSKKPRSKKSTLPVGFSISDRVTSWASEKGHKNLPAHLEYFISKAAANGYKYVDWDQAFMNAIRDNWARIGETGPPYQHKKSRAEENAEIIAGLTGSNRRNENERTIDITATATSTRVMD